MTEVPKKRLGKIAIIGDAQASREKQKLLAATINLIRRDALVDVLKADTSEEDLFKKLQTEQYTVVLAPWHLYMTWDRTEAFFGKTRKGGPAFAGYFADGLGTDKIPPLPLTGWSRFILIDFHRSNPQEIRTLLLSLGLENQRTGIRPVLDSTSPVYCDRWHHEGELGDRLNQIRALIRSGDEIWHSRQSAVELCYLALWNLVFVHGSGKGNKTGTGLQPRAYFEIGSNPRTLAIRLCLELPAWKISDALDQFWPNRQSNDLSHFASVLQQYSDYVRVQKIAETHFYEVLIGFFPTLNFLRKSPEMRTLWIDVIHKNLVTEIPYQNPGPEASWLRSLMEPNSAATKTPALLHPIEQQEKERKLLAKIADMHQKVRGLKKIIAQKDEAIRELKLGGVGTAPPLTPPDAETLLTAFQEKHLEAKLEIEYMSKEIAKLTEKNSDPERVKFLEKEISYLLEREKNWILSLGKSLQLFKSGRSAANDNSKIRKTG